MPSGPTDGELLGAHALAEVGLDPGHRGERPDAALAEVVAAGGVLEGLHVVLGDRLARPVGGRADELLLLRDQGEAAERAVADPAEAGGPRHHLGDVPVGVVVGEDRALRVLGHSGGSQVAGGGEDRVVGVVRVLGAVVVGVDAVGGPGRGHELHPALGAGGRGPEVLAEAALDLVDRGEDGGAGGTEVVRLRGGLVDRAEVGGDRDGPAGGGHEREPAAAAPCRRPSRCPSRSRRRTSAPWCRRCWAAWAPASGASAGCLGIGFAGGSSVTGG